MIMVNLFHFKKEEKTKKSLFIQTNVKTPLEIVVAIGKTHMIGIGEIGNESATVEKRIPIFGAPPTPEDVAKEVLQKLGIPKSEWEEILKTKKEIVL